MKAYYETLAGLLVWTPSPLLPRVVYNGYTICKHIEHDRIFYHIAQYDPEHHNGKALLTSTSGDNLPEILANIDAPIA